MFVLSSLLTTQSSLSPQCSGNPVLTRLSNQLWLSSDCPLSLSLGSSGVHCRLQTGDWRPRDWRGSGRPCTGNITIYCLSHHTSHITPCIRGLALLPRNYYMRSQCYNCRHGMTMIAKQSKFIKDLNFSFFFLLLFYPCV